ncbi:TPA: hypothetical protein DDZ49_01605 [Candidatus Wolfebacteria bacterium]|nr:MAG: hypothetical protein UX58_C0003G0017 [Candidatus Wolfebacteria bacterium GW2011_GWB2_46_69]KKU59318.1 MAG: hypothetical protein UX83_C0006G0088 [Candidatus Wolfebacteria bacterium GW2011_GWE2_47_12]HAL24896.1 hypothetical protein [Candidatus Wolfebacteria bacterium]HBD18467.1 hypothetical protein [Candidatus Wolfebacteria bacterium]HBN86854.1 hypothetical protein [Candidatus Wolfebacteria bacterium]
MVSQKTVFVNKMIYNFRMLASPGNNSYLDEEEVLSLLSTNQSSSKLTPYIDRFINNTLASDTENYYLFERQKEKTLSILRKESKKFGGSFILKYPRADFDKSYLPIHSLIALNYLKVIDLQEISIDKDIFSDPLHLFDQTIEAKIVLSDEVISNKQPLKPKFSFADGVLHFKNKDILISKSYTNPRKLLDIILNEPNKTWDYSEIWEEWDELENYNPLKRNRFYNAAYDVNQKVGIATDVNDFLEYTTNEVKINKKYL